MKPPPPAPSSITAAVASFAPVCVAAEQQLQTRGRAAWVRTFRPSGCGAYVHVDGAVVVGSFFYVKNKPGKKTEYLPELLEDVRAETGLVFEAICSSCDAVCNSGQTAGA